MRKTILLSIFCALCQLITAQSREKAEQKFLTFLNNVLEYSSRQDWKHEGTGVMSIDSAFAISKEGLLTVTVRYTNDSTFTKVRMSAPVNKIDAAAYDLYLILKYKNEAVNIYEAGKGNEDWKLVNKSDLFYLGVPVPGNTDYKGKLKILLANLLKFYKKDLL